MNELVSPDFQLSRNPDPREQLADGLTMSLDLDKVQKAADYLTSPSARHGEPEADYAVLGRSSLAIAAGLDVRGITEGSVTDKNRLHVPIALHAENAVGDKMIQWFKENVGSTTPGEPIKLRKQFVPIGRLLYQAGLVRVGSDEIADAIEQNLIGVESLQPDDDRPSYRITDTGLAVPISPWELKVHERHLLAKDSMVNLWLHGRRYIMPNTVAVPHEADDEFASFTVASGMVAPGPYVLSVNGASSPHGVLEQIPSARIIDDQRSGLNANLGPKRRGYQGEFINTNPGSGQTYGNTSIDFEVFKPNPDTEEGMRRITVPEIDWQKMPSDERAKIHKNGISLGETIRPFLPTIVRSLDANNCALVITRNGVTEIVDDGFPSFNAKNIESGAISSGVRRTIPVDLNSIRPLTEQLGMVANNPRVVVARNINPGDIAEIMRSADLEAMVVHQDGDITTSADEHSALMKMVNEGRLVGWFNNGELKILHKSGFRVSLENSQRIEDLEFIFAMFGSHTEEAVTRSNGQIEEFISTLLDLGIDPYKLGFTHGNGPGIMRAVDLGARKFGAMSLGSGISLEHVGQDTAPGQTPEAEILFHSTSRHTRQAILMRTSDSQQYWEGGEGTYGEEAGIANTTIKLGDHLPAGNHMYCDHKLFTYIKAQRQHMAELGTLQPWVPNTFEHHKSAAAGAERSLEILDNLAEYWREIGIPKREIEISFANRLRTIEQIGRTLSPKIVAAAEDFLG